ncbi:MAG TPA: BadF/BadG/BcrA/BcrD ATPase family protein, partial [Gemmatimonadaceae bacterium]|nr:BadF/BadG/BcrA/BcrD ATPase family protein [Gemmatimonadaceae bacterium]
MTAIVVGVDGGGSRTRAMVADEAGKEIVTVEGGPSAVRPGQVERSAETIAATVKDALLACDMAHVTPKVLCIGVAGAGREPEREALWQSLMGRELADDVVVHPDAMIALDDAFGEGPGLLVIAGTGSVGYGRGPAGTFARCGGWGPMCGDEGSGMWIGRRALSIVTAAHDGREPETLLTGAVLTAAEVNDVSDLVAWAAAATPATLATLAPVVMSVAQAGDLRANSLVTLAVEELVL